ncbi:MAG: phosphoribosylformylglycinamidine cyclo-ligase [Propionibacteriaceae bacterium]|jgi:phosphoribosylformylglycinamidine cyclo-ligase|nr:phosphoribosylformylglycinamidine cyclo-ligase [Propionibacteriaceae bacterium]
MTEQSAYAAAGVDIEAGEQAVELMKASVASTRRPEVIGGLGGFAGLFDASFLKGYRQPVLTTSTDGVGTKVAIAQAMGVYDTIGRDLVAMLVDDLVVVGAQPLFVTDYIACGSVVPTRIAAIVAGIADGCRRAGAALIGGETAEHPGLLGPDEFDVAGATTGVVEREDMLGADRIAPGDVVVMLASSGLHSNGYSLARQVLLAKTGWSLDRDLPELGMPLGQALLEPTTIYALDCLAAIALGGVHAMSHITGGGLVNNLARVMPAGLTAVLRRDSWRPPSIFRLIQEVGQISQADIEAALNMGVGMVMVCAPDRAEAIIDLLTRRGLRAWVGGEVRQRQSGQLSAELIGHHLD